MLGINKKLLKLEEKNEHIMAGIIGAGQMGNGMVSQMSAMKGIRPAIVADINIENAVRAYKDAGMSEDDYKIVNTVSEANDWIGKGKYLVTDNAELAAQIDAIDVNIDATGVPEVGAKVAIDSINNKKHIVMLNVETDVVIGPILKKMADNAGVVYTGSAGDEPGAVKEMYDFADALGFEVLVIGKGKNNKLDYSCNPETVYEEATRKGVSPKMLTSFKDGTKTMVEMTAMSNSTGFVPDVRGAHGAAGQVSDLPGLFMLKEEGGILNNYGVVDYINGVAPGVFIIIRSDLPSVNHEMNYLKMGDGPNYVLYRPYHLCSLETPLSAVKAVLDNQSTIVPISGPVSETITVAKTDLAEGQTLDGIGGYTVYGSFESAVNAKKSNALPLGLVTKKTKMKRNVKKGEILTYDMVDLDTDSLIYQMRKFQDRFF